MNEISLNMIWISFISISNGEVLQDFRKSSWSFRKWRCLGRRVLVVLPVVCQYQFLGQWTHLKSVQRWSGRSNVYPWLKNCIYFQVGVPKWNSVSSRSDIWYQPESLFCGPALESTPSLISCVDCWLGVNGSWFKTLGKTSCYWDNYNFKLTREFLGLFCTFLKKSFVFRVTETEQKVRDYWLPSLQIEKFTLLHSRLKMYKKRHEMNFWSSVSANGESTRLCHK